MGTRLAILCGGAEAAVPDILQPNGLILGARGDIPDAF